VFALFDEDGDGLLSYREFIAIMKDRLHRGFKVRPVTGKLPLKKSRVFRIKFLGNTRGQCELSDLLG